MIPAALKRRIPDTVDRVFYMKFPPGTTPEQMAQITLRLINALVREGVRDPYVRSVANAIINEAGVDPVDKPAVVRAVHAWVQRRFKYEYDPRNIEMVTGVRQALEASLKQGRYKEDCDGMVTVEAALLGALLGIGNVRTTIIKADRRAPDQWSHIYLQVRVNGKWVALDPIMNGEDPRRKKKPVGWEAPKFFARRRVPIGDGPGLELTAQREGMRVYERGGTGMGSYNWIPKQVGPSAKGNAMAYEDDTWFNRLPDLSDDPSEDDPNFYGLGAVMSHDYQQRSLVKGGARERAEGITGLGAVLSNAYAQQMGVPNYRPTTTGEDPQAAAGTPYWEAPGTVGGAMRSQQVKTAGVSGVGDYIQLGQAAANGGWESVMQNLLQTSATIASQAQLTSINRTRIQQGLPPLRADQITVAKSGERQTAGAAVNIGGVVAAVAVGGAILWALSRSRR